MNYTHNGTRYNEGGGLTREFFEPTGPIQLRPDSAQMVLHMFHISKDWSCLFLDFFACCCVLISGQAPPQSEITSTSTIRSHVTRLNNLDLYELAQKFVKFSKDLSP